VTRGPRQAPERRRGKPRRRFAWGKALPQSRGMLIVALVAPLILQRLRRRMPR
jgi:hypothetical protein